MSALLWPTRDGVTAGTASSWRPEPQLHQLKQLCHGVGLGGLKNLGSEFWKGLSHTKLVVLFLERCEWSADHLGSSGQWRSANAEGSDHAMWSADHFVTVA